MQHFNIVWASAYGWTIFRGIYHQHECWRFCIIITLL